MNRRNEYKTLQLCKQVERTLGMFLAGEVDDEVLDGLAVVSVHALAGPSLLLVEVALPPDKHDLAREVVLDHLHRAGGLLRHEVARAVNRKRTPQLAFRVVRDDDDGPPDSEAGRHSPRSSSS